MNPEDSEVIPSNLDPTSFVQAQHHRPAVMVDHCEPQPDPVTFIEVPEAKPVTTAGLHIAQAAAQPSAIKVRVNPPYRVQHLGVIYTDGQVVAVPEDVAALWERSAWVKRVKTTRTRTKQEKN